MSIATSLPNKRWPAGIPVRKGSSLDQAQKDTIDAAIADYEKLTQFRFFTRDDQEAFIHFKKDDTIGGCGNSHIGRTGGEMVINLKTGCDKGTVIHELGHALGLHHEMQRHDREEYVDIIDANVDSEHEHNFDPVPASESVLYGPYDYGSIMHYPERAFSSNGGKTIDSPEPIGQRNGLSPGDLRIVRVLQRSNASVHSINGDGTAGPEVTRYRWTEGWTTIRFFRIGLTDFLFTLKASNGIAHIHIMNGDGTVGQRIEERNWTSGWTHACFYKVFLADYLLLLKKGSSTIHIHKVNGDGSIGQQIQNLNWTNGYSTALHFSQGLNNFMFFIKKSNGRVKVKEVRIDGTLGRNIASRNWSGGWSHGAIYEKDWGQKYLMLLKQSNGLLKVRKLNGDGTPGNTVRTLNWSAGWSDLSIMDKRYFMVAKASGSAHTI